MSHYTIGYHDNQNHHFEICEYADDAFSAIRQAQQDLPGLLSSHKSEYVIKEDWWITFKILNPHSLQQDVLYVAHF